MCKVIRKKLHTVHAIHPQSGCLLRGSKTCDRYWCDDPVEIGHTLCSWHKAHPNYTQLCECGKEITYRASYCSKCVAKHRKK